MDLVWLVGFGRFGFGRFDLLALVLELGTFGF